MATEIRTEAYALNFIKSYLPAWSDVTEDDIECTQMPSGTNYVLRIKNSMSAEPEWIIYRVFTTSKTINVEQERKVFQKLADLGIGPKSYGSDKYCRLEQYLDGYAPVTLDDCQESHIIEHICRLTRQLKNVDMSDICSLTQNVFMDNILKWREIAISMYPPPPDIPEYRKALLPEIEELLSEETLNTVRSLLPAEYNPIFCHGDFNNDNILYKPGSNQGFIDFEYAGYSYDAFDIANLINETHFDNCEPEFPFYTFLEASKCDNEGIAKWVKAYGKGVDFWVEVKIFICLNNIYWAMWALTMVQSWERNDEYDHMSYGPFRFAFYKKEIEEIQELGREGLLEVGKQYFS